MTIPAIGRDAFAAAGDVIARPHGNCYWLLPGRVLAGEHPGAIAVPDGIARTGTLVGCLLREQGFDAADALAVIDRKWQAMDKRTRHPHSPVTRGQITFVEEWPDVPRK